MRFGVSSYSFWHFRGEPYPLENVLEDAKRMGFDGIEVLERQLGEDDSLARLHRLRRQPLTLGLDIYAVSTHQDFVYPDPEDRKKQIEQTIRSLEVAEALGAGCIRLNSGRWKTIKSFDDLMAANGQEPPLPGYTEEDAFGWVIDSIRALIPEAKKRGVILGLENHWGLTYRAEGVKRIVNQIASPYMGVVLDTGNFKENMYEQMEELANLAVLVHAKTYLGGGEWYDLDIDYVRVGQILKRNGYKGYVSLEFEGKMDPQKAVPQSLDMLKRSLSQTAARS